MSTFSLPSFGSTTYTLFLEAKSKNMMIFAEHIALLFMKWCYTTSQAWCNFTTTTITTPFPLLGGEMKYCLFSCIQFWPEIPHFPQILRRHCKGALPNMIFEVVLPLPYEVNAFQLNQSTFSLINKDEKVIFSLFYPFFHRFDDVTRRHCNVGFLTICFKQKMIWPIQIYILFIGWNTF